jgi:hypothetical protein
VALALRLGARHSGSCGVAAAEAIQDLTGRQVPFELIESGSDSQREAFSEQELIEGWIAESVLI